MMIKLCSFGQSIFMWIMLRFLLLFLCFHISSPSIQQASGSLSSPYPTSSVFISTGLYFHTFFKGVPLSIELPWTRMPCFQFCFFSVNCWCLFSNNDVAGTWTWVFLFWVKCSRLSGWGIWGIIPGRGSVNRILHLI